MPKNPQGRLELTWMGKDLALIPFKDGKYDYAWVDPADPRVTEVRSIDETGTVGVADAVRDDDGTMIAAGSVDNLLIVGDSGDALRALGTVPKYADRFKGQVKLVYIDPPFNTQKTFKRYSDQMEHSVWLTFMRDRIRDIKPLLAPDASVWVHLDDNEVHRMRVLLDEEFGAANCATQIVWQKRTTRENRAVFSDNHDHLLVYTLGDVTAWRDVRNRLDRSGEDSNPDNDPRGTWSSIPFTAQGHRPNQMYPITTPTGVVHFPPKGRCWGSIESRFLELREQGRIHFTKNGDGKPRIKQYTYEAKGFVPHTLWLSEEVGANDTAKDEIGDLFADVEDLFDTPKPERLLERIVHIGSNPGDIVLDCFAGSGTTAAVAQKMGRRWVTVELLEENAETFTIPRMTKVVDGTDRGGISVQKVRVAANGVELPEGMTPAQAQAFNTALTKTASGVDVEVDVAKETAKLARAAKKAGTVELTDDELATLARLATKLAKSAETTIDVSTQALAPLRATTKTRDESKVRWSGGGGFTVARLGPSMYDVEDGANGKVEVFLSPAATNGAWAGAITGQLGYRRTPDHQVFAGYKGRERLAVIDGVADEAVIRDLHAHLGESETLLVVAKAALDDVESLLRDLTPGSTLRVAPGGILPKGKVVR